MLGTDRRLRSGGRASSNCSLSSCTVASSKHAGTTAKPSCSTSSLKPLNLLVSFRFNVAYLGRTLCLIGGLRDLSGLCVSQNLPLARYTHLAVVRFMAEEVPMKSRTLLLMLLACAPA